MATTTKKKTTRTSKTGVKAGVRKPKVTVSFRTPEAAVAAFEKIAAKESKPGRPVPVSAIYNQAFAEFLRRQGTKLPAEVW